MNAMNFNDEHEHDSDGSDLEPVDRDEVLLYRLLDGDSTDADWHEFELMADRQQGLWKQMVLAMRSETQLCRSVNQVVSVADRVELPKATLLAGPAMLDSPLVQITRPVRLNPWLRQASGWAAAILISVLWVTFEITSIPAKDSSDPSGVPGSVAFESQSDTPSQLATGGRDPKMVSLSSGEAFQKYMETGKEEGSILGELPRTIIKSRVLPGEGEYEVLYLRRIVEKAQLNKTYQTGIDEYGIPVGVPVRYENTQLGTEF